MKKLKVSKAKQKEIVNFLEDRFKYLEGLRNDFDAEIIEEVELYNDHDKFMQPWDKNTKIGKKWWEEKRTIPYIYTIVQTMVARLIQSFFGKQNYLRIYIEDENYEDIEDDLQSWLQAELDKIKLKRRSRDYLEEALTQRTTWLRMRPEQKEGKMEKIDFDVYQWFDVWFDTKARTVDETDFFLRNIVKMWRIKENKFYMNTKQISKTVPPDDEIKERQTYEVKHSKNKEITYYDQEKNNVSDEVELMDYVGWYDMSEDKNKPDYKPVIFTWANREVLISIQEIDLPTRRKFLIFPVRPIRQANSLVGKSISQIVGDLQYLLNEVVSLTIQNFKLLIKLLFKYKDNADVDLSELFAGGGNAIPWDEDPNEIDVFQIRDMVQAGLVVISWIIQFMQQATGAVDYLMGTSAGRGTTETASGIKTITEQAMFKFAMMAENVYGDLQDLIHYMMILWSHYNPNKVLEKFPKLKELFNLTPEMLEESYIFDIGLNDLTLRRDVERTSFINGANIIAGLLKEVQGNTPEFLREVMKKLEMSKGKIKKIMQGAKSPADMAQLQAMITQAMQATAQGGGGTAEQQRGGSTKVAPNAENAAAPEEEAENTTPKQPGTI
jgi:hypothetical protein